MLAIGEVVLGGSVRGARGGRAQRTACDGLRVRAHRHRRVELGFGSHHCLGFRSPSRRPVSVGYATCVTGSKDGLCSGKVACMPHNNAERYNNNNAEFWNWVSPRHEKARAAGRMSIGLA